MKGIWIPILTVLAFSAGLFAAQIVSEEQAVKDMLPGGGKAAALALSGDNVKLILEKAGEESAKGIAAGKKVKYYTGSEGVAIIEHQEGKWGEIELIVLVKSGKVVNLEVLASSEKRGRPIVMRTFLNQFRGKTTADNMKIGKNIDAVTSATISSQAVMFMVKRALVIAEIIEPAAGGPKIKPAGKK